MSVDKLFTQLERRTENDLYRKAFNAATKSQQSILREVDASKIMNSKKSWGLEFLWFFGSILIGILLGYLLAQSVALLMPHAYSLLVNYFGNSQINVFYLFALLCFVGVYITRVTIWVLRSL